jgi:CHAD domain-containing protein
MKAAKVRGLRPEEPLRANAARIVAVRLDEVESFAERALRPGEGEARHEMRIAAKRLRYALDVLGDCFGQDGTRARAAAKELQSILGDLRDCEAMLARGAGIASLEVLLRTRRELLYAGFREFWARHTTVDALEGLRRAVS